MVQSEGGQVIIS